MWGLEDLLRGAVVVGFLILASGPWDWFQLPAWLLGVLGVLLLAYVVLVPLWRYHVHRWEVTESAVYTQTGWWARERRIAPMSRVQTVDHREGAITTASSAGALTIEGLDQQRALAVVQDLTRMADSVPGDAT
jgi:membrane protein YdbS with pleckstrin-like domain